MKLIRYEYEYIHTYLWEICNSHDEYAYQLHPINHIQIACTVSMFNKVRGRFPVSTSTELTDNSLLLPLLGMVSPTEIVGGATFNVLRLPTAGIDAQ